MARGKSSRHAACLGLGLLAVIASGLAERAAGQSAPTQQPPPPFEGKTTEEYNRRLAELRQKLPAESAGADEYRIGSDDLIDINVFEAPELNRQLRVSASGEVYLPLLGAVRCAGLTARELEFVLEELLRRTFMKDPHVGVFVKDMQSHRVSVFGAVKKPGVFQVRGAKSLVEMLSMAEGLAEDAGDTVLVMHGGGVRDNLPPNAEAGPAAPAGDAETPPGNASAASAGPPAGTTEVELKRLLESPDSSSNVTVFPGDVVKVTRAGIVYVVGEVRKPGGFVLKSNENISVLQALALAEGLTPTSRTSAAKIIRTSEVTGKRTEIPIHLGKILAGKAEDPVLQPRDIVFVPNSTARTSMLRGTEAAISILSGLIIFRR